MMTNFLTYYFLTNRNRWLRRIDMFIARMGSDADIDPSLSWNFEYLSFKLLPANGPGAGSIQAGDLKTWALGVKTFMMLHGWGWIEADMQILGIPPTRIDPMGLCDRAMFRIVDLSDPNIREQ